MTTKELGALSGLKVQPKWRMVLVHERLFGRGDSGDWFEYPPAEVGQVVDGVRDPAEPSV